LEDAGKDTVKALEVAKYFYKKNLIIVNIDYQHIASKVKNIFILKYNKEQPMPVYISTFFNSKSTKNQF